MARQKWAGSLNEFVPQSSAQSSSHRSARRAKTHLHLDRQTFFELLLGGRSQSGLNRTERATERATEGRFMNFMFAESKVAAVHFRVESVRRPLFKVACRLSDFRLNSRKARIPSIMASQGRGRDLDRRRKRIKGGGSRATLCRRAHPSVDRRMPLHLVHLGPLGSSNSHHRRTLELVL